VIQAPKLEGSASCATNSAIRVGSHMRSPKSPRMAIASASSGILLCAMRLSHSRSHLRLLHQPPNRHRAHVEGICRDAVHEVAIGRLESSFHVPHAQALAAVLQLEANNHLRLITIQRARHVQQHLV
jgi:hypothetical protein